MLRFILRRLVFTAVMLIGITAITFALARILPGDPARLIAGPRASAAAVAEIRHAEGFDQPVFQQFILYVKRLASGNLGRSLVTRRPVTKDIAQYFPATLELVIAASIIGGVLGIGIGVFAAVRHGTAIDIGGRLIAIFGLSMPDFWLAILMQLIFFSLLSLLPFGGRLDTGVAAPAQITGLLTIDSLIAGRWDLFLQSITHLIMPAMVLMMPLMGLMVRVVRASTLEALAQDHMRTARAKGLHPIRLYLQHALRNALIPTVTVFGLDLGLLMSGAVLVELVFAWPGLGRYTANAVSNSDYNAIMGITIVTSVVYVLINLAVDILYTYLDPRVRLS
jgi:peptide/nickel transport system permease protein